MHAIWQYELGGPEVRLHEEVAGRIDAVGAGVEVLIPDSQR